MSSAKHTHTPGPWAWDERGCELRPVEARPDVSAVHTIISTDGSGCVGYLGAANEDVLAEDTANLHLIAAAPELLEALLALLAADRRPAQEQGWDVVEARARAYEVAAKATGWGVR